MNLSELLQSGYKKLGQLRAYPTTGGSATTAVVVQLKNKKSIAKGVLFVIADSAGAAPEGEFQRITGYAKVTGTFTVDTLTAIASGDTVGVASDLYPIHTMVELANDSLRALGDIEVEDTTTLDSVSNQTEYDLPVAWKRSLLELYIQGKTDDANDNQWYQLYDYQKFPGTPGTVGTLITPYLASGRDLKAVYLGKHPRVSAFDDAIDDVINPEVAMWSLVGEMLNWQWARGHKDNVGQDLTNAKRELRRALAEWPIKRRTRKSKLFTMPRKRRSEYTGEVDSVRI